jgi:hypothetical protein
MRAFVPPRDNLYLVKDCQWKVAFSYLSGIFLVVVNYVNEKELRVTSRRIDSCSGWKDKLKVFLFFPGKKLEVLVGSSDKEEKSVLYSVNFTLEKKEYRRIKIPKIIMHNFISYDLCSQRLNTIKHILDLNPDYSYYFFTDETMEEFTKKYYPEHYELLKSICAGAYRSDLFRALFLKKYGGFYMDCKTVLLTPLDDLIGDEDYLLSASFIPGIGLNAFMGWPPGDSFNHLEAIIEGLKRRENLVGPRALNHVVHLANVKEIMHAEELFMYKDGKLFAWRNLPNRDTLSDEIRPRYLELDRLGYYFRREIAKNIYLVIDNTEEEVVILEKGKNIIIQRRPERSYIFLDENCLQYKGKVEIKEDKVVLGLH